MRLLLTMAVITAACGMMACASARSTRSEAGSDLAMIQSQLDASNEKLEQLSQQVALIQMLVDTHQRALQDLKTPEDAGTESRQLSTIPGDDTATPPPPAPELSDLSVIEPPSALQDSASSEDVGEGPSLPSTVPEEEAEPAGGPAAAPPIESTVSETPQPSSPPRVQATQTPSSISPEEERLPSSAGTDSTPVKEPNPFYQEAMEIFRSGDYELAADLFEDFVEEFPEDDLSDNALYWAGECKYTKKKFSEAILRFKRVVEEYPAGSKVPDALLKIGFAYISLGDMESAETYLKQVIAQYPFSSAATKAEARLKALQGQ